jgi:hypothetical protein
VASTNVEDSVLVSGKAYSVGGGVDVGKSCCIASEM